MRSTSVGFAGEDVADTESHTGAPVPGAAATAATGCDVSPTELMLQRLASENSKNRVARSLLMQKIEAAKLQFSATSGRDSPLCEIHILVGKRVTKSGNLEIFRTVGFVELRVCLV
jgi:hypothetical protein